MIRQLSVTRPVWVLGLLLGLGACSGTPSHFQNEQGFQELSTPFTHQWVESTHPFSGAAVIDVDNDGRMEVFVGGGQGQDDVLLAYQDGQLVNRIQGTGLSSTTATYGPVSIDIDGDKDTDLIVPRDDGVYLYLNQNAVFKERKLAVKLPENSVPLSVTVSDIDKDGDADLYLSAFVNTATFRSAVFNDPGHAKPNVLLRNDGNLNFTDITARSGTAGKQNTFLSVFSDLNGDGFQDLLVSQNTGEVEIFRNNGKGRFTAIPTQSGFGFWMGVAVGDIDNDGDNDLFFSNAGDSIPAFLTKGDIRDDQRHNTEWLLLRNEGGFRFTDVTGAYQLSGEGFAWGAVFEDLNLDGQLDLLVAQNYLKWPLHKLFKLPARTYLQTSHTGQRQFQHVKALGLENPYFGQSPLIVDVNNDGRPDVIWLNMNGPVRAFINRSQQNFLTLRPADNVAMLGTLVTVETLDGNSYTREVNTSTGMLTDQTPDLFFGLGDQNHVKAIHIRRPNGRTETIENPEINRRISLQ